MVSIDFASNNEFLSPKTRYDPSRVDGRQNRDCRGAMSTGLVEETLRILTAAERSRVPLRALGGVAIYLHTAELMHPSLERNIEDIDLATGKGQVQAVSELLTSLGYTPNVNFNALHGARRLLFHDEKNQRKLDVFVNNFEMCHVLPLTERLELEPVTLPLAELLLTKLQIIELNNKDILDVFALVLAHNVGDHDNETINANWIAGLCARDWGLYRTLQLNLERLRDNLSAVRLGDPEQSIIAQRLALLAEAIEEEPKKPRWKLRARVGDRVRWYQDPEEIG
jgi:hypothetical protein